MIWPPPPPPRSRPHWSVWFLVGVSVLVFVLFTGLFVYLNPPPGSNCYDWWVYCPTGPGATPLGTALAVGNGTGACPAGNGTSPSECAYTFAITDATGGLAARDLTFALLKTTATPLGAAFTVSLTNPDGGWIAVWNSSAAVWSTDGACGSTHCLSDPLTAGELFLLKAVPDGGLPYSHQDDEIQVVAVAGDFSGWVDAPID